MNEAYLIPASSPGWKSASSTSQPLRSLYRVYMRKSICAQSCDSVPPAPALISTMALRWSCGPLSIFDSSSRCAPCSASATASFASPRVASSFASSASSWRATASSSRCRSRSYCASCISRPLFSLLSAWARFWSSQKPGCTLSRSISSTRARLRSMSKRPPERVEAPRELVQLGWQRRHVCPLPRNRPGGKGTSPRLRERAPDHPLEAEQTPLCRAQPAGPGGRGVAVSPAMQDAVREQPPQLDRERPAAFAGLPPRRLDRDHHVSESSGLLERKGEHVRRPVLAAPPAVQRSDLAIRDERDGDVFPHPAPCRGADHGRGVRASLHLHGDLDAGRLLAIRSHARVGRGSRA